MCCYNLSRWRLIQTSHSRFWSRPTVQCKEDDSSSYFFNYRKLALHSCIDPTEQKNKLWTTVDTNVIVAVLKITHLFLFFKITRLMFLGDKRTISIVCDKIMCSPGTCWHQFAPLGIVSDICTLQLGESPKKKKEKQIFLHDSCTFLLLFMH